MGAKYIGLLDISGIQDHLFRNSKLQAIALASKNIEGLGEDNGLFVCEAKKAGVELVIHAGGNAAFISDTKDQMKMVFASISRALIEKGEGLSVIAAIHPFEEGTLAREYVNALAILERRKWTQPRSVDFIFAGMECPEPKLNGKSEIPIKQVSSHGFYEPLQMEDLIANGYWVIPGRSEPVKENTDLMAVVSVDGLGMGRRIRNWLEESTNKTDEQFKIEFNAWSSYIKRRWRDAWDACLKELRDEIFTERNGSRCFAHAYQTGRYLKLHKNKDLYYYPIRKIYQGGDDLSFICDARIAFSFTTSLIRKLEKDESNVNEVPDSFRLLTVSAGIVLLDSHYPFSRAVSLSEMTRKIAKRRSEELRECNSIAPSCIDWWLNRQGALERDYLAHSLRPYPLHDNPDTPCWDHFDRMVMPEFWNVFGDSRNKLKDLLDAAETGENAVERFIKTRPIQGYDILKKSMPERYNRDTLFESNGQYTPVVDAGEIFDIHFPYSPKETR